VKRSERTRVGRTEHRESKVEHERSNTCNDGVRSCEELLVLESRSVCQCRASGESSGSEDDGRVVRSHYPECSPGLLPAVRLGRDEDWCGLVRSRDCGAGCQSPGWEWEDSLGRTGTQGERVHQRLLRLDPRLEHDEYTRQRTSRRSSLDGERGRHLSNLRILSHLSLEALNSEESAQVRRDRVESARVDNDGFVRESRALVRLRHVATEGRLARQVDVVHAVLACDFDEESSVEGVGTDEGDDELRLLDHREEGGFIRCVCDEDRDLDTGVLFRLVSNPFLPLTPVDSTRPPRIHPHERAPSHSPPQPPRSLAPLCLQLTFNACPTLPALLPATAHLRSPATVLRYRKTSWPVNPLAPE
jgi:hypothetical protein